MKKLVYLFLFLCSVSCSEKEEKITLEKGISYQLAKYREQQISTVVYHLHFKIPIERKKPISSKLKVDFTVNDLKMMFF